MREVALVFLFSLVKPYTMQAASSVFAWCPVHSLAFLSVAAFLHRAAWSNMPLKWDAPFRGGFEVGYFFGFSGFVNCP